MKNIVIVGAGFAGLAVALGLEKKFKDDKDIHIILIDKRDYHLFSPNLFEVATSEEELTSVLQIKKSIALPLKEILFNKRINLIQGECSEVDPKNKTVLVGIKKINYDFLVLAAGGVPGFNQTYGVRENSLPLENLSDALRIRNRVEFSIQSRSHDAKKQFLRFVVAGGRSEGIEFAAELKKLLDFLSWKYSYPKQYLEILVVENSNKLLSGMGQGLSNDVFSRLKDLGVNCLFNQKIIKADHHFIEFFSGEKINYELFFWMQNILAAKIRFVNTKTENIKDYLETDNRCRLKDNNDIFVIGDMAIKENFLRYPQEAIHQGRYLANTLPLLMQNQNPEPYKTENYNLVIKVSGKWAIVYKKHLYLTGYIAYLFSLVQHFRYYCSLLGIRKAFRYIIREMDLFSRND